MKIIYFVTSNADKFDYWRLYVPKMLDAKNTKALCEMTDEQMEKWMAYFSKNNQFLQLGKWLKSQSN
jgi:hypothetical protein